MNFVLAISSAVSDMIVLSVQILILSIITEKRYTKIRFVAVVIVAAITGFVSDWFFYGQEENITFPFLIFECLRLCLLAMLALKTFKLKDIMILMIIQYLCSILNAALIALFPQKILVKNPYIKCIFMIIIPTFMLIIAISFKIKTKYKTKIINSAASSIPVYTYICIFIAIFLEGGLIEVLCYDTSKIEMRIMTAKILSLLLIICVTVLVVSLTINVLYQKYYSGLNIILREQVNSQLKHYEKIEKINSEIQSFKHDFNNHMKCLESMMISKKYEDAMAYLEKISGMMPFGEFIFKTGNYISDAILTETQENFSKENITIEFKGFIPPEIDNTDLCIILSNSIKNAAEASCVLNGSKNISVYGNYQQGIFILIIKNPTTLEGNEKDIFPKTSKSDNLSHGFGFSNIQYVVNKYEGTMHTQLEDGFFTLSITLKLH